MANELVFRLRRSLAIPGMQLGLRAQELLADSNVGFQKIIPALSTDAEIDLVVNVMDVVVIGIEADQDCTVKINSTTPAPEDTFLITANIPLIWTSGDPIATQFIVNDVTKLFVTTGGTDTLLKLMIGLDATPVLGP